VLLAAEFGSISAIYLYLFPLALLGEDARIYHAATRAWMSGGDPWAAGYNGQLFAAPPLTLLPFAPFAWMPQDAFVAVVMVASVTAALYALRALGLPAWWLLFPPLVQGLAEGNPNVIVLALLVSGNRIGGGLAVLLKAYVAIPLLLLGRVRELVLAVVATTLTLPILPWSAFLSHDVTGTLSLQSAGGMSAWAWLPLVPVALVLLAVNGRQQTSWWAVPALWPDTQFHYSVLALPAITPLSAAVLAIPIPGSPVVALGVAVAERRLRASARTRHAVNRWLPAALVRAITRDDTSLKLQ
jgi:hypothetical protein